MNKHIEYSKFNALHFITFTEEQKLRLKAYFNIRNERGAASRFQILRSLVRTKAFTRSVYPPNWKIS